MKRLILAGIMAAGLLGFSHPCARAYVIDGSVLDWGVDLSQANSKGYLDTHLPSGGLDIDTITEDNADKFSKWTDVGPGWSYYNYFDAEAIYFDNDQNNAYIAVVQGLPINGYQVNGYPRFYPGDIAINTGGPNTEYGIDVSTFDSASKKAKLYEVSSWNDVYYPGFSISNPWTISSGIFKGDIDFVYSVSQNTHYVMEASIPLSLFGLSANPGDPVYSLGIHWTQECGNDYLNLSADVNPVPEPGSLILLVTGLFGLAGFLNRSKINRLKNYG